MKLFVSLALGAALALSIGGPLALAQQGGAAPLAAPAAAAAAPANPVAAAAERSAKADRRMGMTEAVTAADFKKIEGGPLLVAAYGVVWAVFFGVLVYTFVRMRRVGDELRRLEAQVQASRTE